MKKATRQQTKTHNARLVLKTIYERSPVSRADISRATHLTRPTISAIVSELMDDGLVDEIGHGESQGGKPPILLSANEASFNIIGIDLSNSEFRGGIFDLRGNSLHSLSLSAHGQTGEAALSLVYDLIDQLLLVATTPLLGIGIGTPGITDTNHGIIHESVNLGWIDLALQDLLQLRYEVPVHIANDSQAAALGEFSFGANNDVSNLVVVNAGSGVSAGIVLNGRVYSGDNFSPGEIGHVTAVENGKQCTCGRYGCLETVASSRAILEGGLTIIDNNPNSTLAHMAANGDVLSTDLILKAFRAGDESVQELITDVGRYLGKAVSYLISSLNIQRLIIGGPIARFGDVLVSSIRQEVDRSVLARIAQTTEIELTSLEADLVILGAVALVRWRELGVV